jgi:glucosylceramidase
MNKTRTSLTSIWVALALVACSSSGGSNPGGGGDGGNSTGGDMASGGSAMGGAQGDGGNGGASSTSSGGSQSYGGQSLGGNSGGSGGVSTSSRGGASGLGGSSTGGATTSTNGSGGAQAGGAQAEGGAQAGGSPGSGGTQAGGSGGGTVTLPSFVTSAPNAYWTTSGTVTTVTSGNADITVNDGTTYQTWDGFGGAFNEMGWDFLSKLSAADRDQAMKLLFDAADGAHFMFGRIPIGASDYAMDRYTDDESPGDYTMDKFSIDRDKQKLIPYVKAAMAVNPQVHLWASPWSPPTWMKDNNDFNGGNMKDDAKTLQAFALYLAKWVKAYDAEGIKVEAIHHQNEPNYETGYPSCIWSASLYSKFIGTYLGPTFASEGVSAQIYLGTMSNNDSGKDGTIISTVTGDSTAMKYVKGFGLQWNMLPVVSSLTSKNLPILQTEHKCGNYPWKPSDYPNFNSSKAPNDHAYGIESWGYIRDWIKAGVNSYSAWNMVLDTIGNGIDSGRLWPQNSLLTVDTSSKKLIPTPAYYVFRHFSQYIAPGAKRVATSGSSPDTLAFKNPDGSIVAVMYNSGSSAKTTTLSIAGSKVQFSIPGSGFATYKK